MGSGGDEIVGLSRAFLYAGAPAVLSTLWRVDDASTARLMEGLYRRWQQGSTVSEALRESQLSLLREPSIADPSFWAGFAVTGSAGGRWERDLPEAAR